VNTVLPATPTRCRVDLEGWDPEIARRVWSDPRPEAIRYRFIELAELLAQIVDDPAYVTLVIPIDVADAVRWREPDQDYNLERGSGLVGGRTMSTGAGRVDVIINAGPLVEFDGQGLPVHNRIHERMRITRRLVIHEAQHAIMQRRGSGFDDYGFEGVAGRFARQLAGNAAKVCDEHRAEWHAIQLTVPGPPTISDVSAVLEALGRQLAAANQVYQAAPNAPDAVYNLAVAVLTACEPFWTSLGYWTAQYRTNDDNIADMPAELAALPLWQRYGGEVWALLQDSLRTIPVEDLTTSAEVLNAAALRVSTTLASSLETMGFRFEDTKDGSAFYITRWDFPS
jgi:hypothetical protein